jgi:hypothetical protein
MDSVNKNSSPHILLEFNKLAVSLLERGKSKEAMNHFLAGLTTVNTAEELVSDKDNSSQHPDARLFHTEDVLHATILPPLECADHSCNFFTLFDHALSYDETQLSNDPNDLSLVSSVYLYNIGLAFHREGYARGKASLLHDALRFYRLAKECSYDSQCHSEDDHLILFAIHNNMGNIFAHFFDRDNARMCYKVMVELAPSMSRILAENEAFFATLYNLISGQEMFQFAPAA